MHKILVCIVWLLPINILAQNLVPNPGFELFYDCPSGLRQLNKTKFWYPGNTGTPEYFRSDCKYLNGKPNSGRGYVGLILFCGYPDAIEYIGVQLTDTLLRGEKYCASFHIRAAESYVYIDQIGMLLSKEKEYVDMFAPIIKRPQVNSGYSLPIIPELGWHQVKSEFVASGGEGYLTIGNFVEPDRHIQEINEFFAYPGLGWNSYYLIDDVALTPIKSNETCEDVQKPEPVFTNRPSRDSVLLSNTFYFDSDEFKLAKSEFDRLIQWKIQLRKYQIIQSNVQAGTDSDADSSYNYLLSCKRSAYILSTLGSALGKSIAVENNGETKPVAENETEVGKQKNRYVEIKVVGFDR